MRQNKKLAMGAFAALLTLVLAGAGCAKKHKPDSSMLNMDTNVADKAMDTNIEGSDSGKIEGLNSVHFDYDKSNLSAEARKIIVGNVSWLRKHPKMNMEIQGHCDRHGSEEYNLALGERRAKAVKQYMVTLGVKANRLSTISYGNERLLDTAETEEADAKNRRANFRPIETVKNTLSQR